MSGKKADCLKIKEAAWETRRLFCLGLFLWEPGYEGAGLADVFGVVGFFVDEGLFEEGDAGDFDDEEGHDDGAYDLPVGSGTDGNERKAPPDGGVTEIIGVAGVAPEAPVHDFAFVGGVGFETSELPIAPCFKYKAYGPEGEANEVPDAEGMLGTIGIGGGQGEGNDAQQDALEHKDLEKAEPPVTTGAVMASEFLVAEVFGLADVAPSEVEGKAEPPKADEDGEEDFAFVVAFAKPVPGVVADDKTQAPEDVDDADVADGDADEPKQDEHAQDGEASEEVGFEEVGDHGLKIRKSSQWSVAGSQKAVGG